MSVYQFSGIITKEEEWYVARCLELDVTSQGETIEEAKKNLKEAIALYLESFGTEDISCKEQDLIYTRLDVAV